MTRERKQKNHAGFTLIELMTAVVIFLLVCGAMFSLLGGSQRHFQTDSQVLGAFQEARLGLDQIARDISDAGYPPQNQYAVIPPAPTAYATAPVAWSPNYPANPCLIGTAGGGTCASPGDFDLILESDFGNGVQWIRYQLVGTTLFRGVVAKAAGADPVAATAAAGVMVPYVLNVMNNPGDAQMGQIRANYPAMFPGGQPVPVFQYTCDNPPGVTALCTAAGANNSPTNVRDVEITLIVQAPQRDAQTGVLRLVELNGRGHRVNPNQ